MKVKGQYTMLNTKQQEFVDHAVKKFGSNELTVSQLKEANKHFGNKYAYLLPKCLLASFN